MTLYTTQLGAGLGLFDETTILLELWKPNMTTAQLYQAALQSGRFPNVTARRLRNIVAECFTPRYLVHNGAPAVHLKELLLGVTPTELRQLMLLFTCRANAILADFIREVYWQKYEAGYSEVSNEDARSFVLKAIDHGKTVKGWSESMVKRVSAYLTGCCSDFGLLENGSKSNRKVLPFRISTKAAAYIAYDLHFSGLGDNAVLNHQDWELFGLERRDTLAEIKKLSLQGLLIVQTASDLTKISWKHKRMEEVCDVLAQS